MKYKTDSQQWVFRAPPLIKFGNDSSKEIGEIIKSLNLAKVLIITDYVIEKLGILNDIKSSLDKFKISYLFFKNIKGEPNIKDVEEGLQILQSQKFDGIVAIGGGSVIDASKAISIMATNKGNIADYKGLDKIPKKRFTNYSSANNSWYW